MIRRKTEYPAGLPSIDAEKKHASGLPDITNDDLGLKKKKILVLSAILGILILAFILFPKQTNFEKLIFTQTTDAAKNSFVLYFDCNDGEVNGMSIRDKKVYNVFGEISLFGSLKIVERDTNGKAEYGSYIGNYNKDKKRIECSWIPPDKEQIKKLNFSVERVKQIEDFLPQNAVNQSTIPKNTPRRKLTPWERMKKTFGI